MTTLAAGDLEALVRTRFPTVSLAVAALRREIPRLAKDEAMLSAIREVVRSLPTRHTLVCGDARDMSWIPDESVHLVVTSPPYWTLKRYRNSPGQLGHVRNYDDFLEQLDVVWRECFRTLVKGGRMVVVVGDVCLSRRSNGRHVVMPLHASIQERCRAMGFDNLAPIIWHKITNASFEVSNGTAFMGKPYEPNAIIKNDIEYMIMQRKPGAYRTPSPAARVLSVIPEQAHRAWFDQVWRLPGAPTNHHPAPFPLELAERLVRMFSFVGDTVLDPFMGTGTTNLAASLWGRNSIGCEVDPVYFEMGRKRLNDCHHNLLSNVDVTTMAATVRRAPDPVGRESGCGESTCSGETRATSC